MPKHAYLSASASHRWLACPPSAKLCAGINDSGSPYAQQGTDAHALCEYKVEKLLGRNPEDPTENLTWFDTEMDDCTDQYAAYVAEQIEEAKTHCSDPLILIEEKLDFSKWVPEGFGTGDCVIIADDVLHIIDFKYGRRESADDVLRLRRSGYLRISLQHPDHPHDDLPASQGQHQYL